MNYGDEKSHENQEYKCIEEDGSHDVWLALPGSVGGSFVLLLTSRERRYFGGHSSGIEAEGGSEKVPFGSIDSTSNSKSLPTGRQPSKWQQLQASKVL